MNEQNLKLIGSFLELELSQNSLYHKNLLSFNSVRNALAFLLKHPLILIIFIRRVNFLASLMVAIYLPYLP